MSRAHHSGAQPSQRMLRVAELVRHALANLIQRGVLNDPVIETHVVTVPRVKMSPDLKLATAYVMPLGGKDVEEVLAALERHRKFLRAEVAQQVNLKFAPDVRFKADSTFDNAARIDALLRKPEVQRDLDKKSDAN
ncbi:MAG TPA: 30S ribosome-binding factor RbfA [Beijerinckiaceae bacterium]|nr:30S ribosome-binding factor RbfA [Beijerinckiaceae bacterium]